VSADAHIEKWALMSHAIQIDAGMKSFALVAIDETGEVFWGSDFGAEPEKLLRRLNTITNDIKSSLKAKATS
jgi:hypothetical protein